MATTVDKTEKRLVRSKSGLRMVSSTEIETSPFLLSEPPWVPDNECAHCMQCQTRFIFSRRRHHCRRCGRCYCNTCCDNKTPLPRMCFVDPVRQCGACAAITKKENEFFDKHLKSLLAGGHFVLVNKEDGDEDVTDNNDMTVLCKLTTDHSQLEFETTNIQHEPVLLRKIDSVKVLTSGVDALGNTIATGIAILYVTDTGDHEVLRMMVSQHSNRRPAMVWLSAMQKAAKLLYEERSSNSIEDD